MQINFAKIKPYLDHHYGNGLCRLRYKNDLARKGYGLGSISRWFNLGNFVVWVKTATSFSITVKVSEQ